MLKIEIMENTISSSTASHYSNPTLFTLVGAGPGDPDLISIKGVKTLKRSQLVIYENTVHPLLLEYAPASARRLCLGEDWGGNSPESRLRLILEEARKVDRVVILAGGEPGLPEFWRSVLNGLENAGHLVEIVPGLGVAQATAISHRIPISSGLDQGYWITGFIPGAAFMQRVVQTLEVGTTVVIPGALEHLNDLVAYLVGWGRPDEMVAVLDQSFHSEQDMVLGTLQTIREGVKNARISGPATLILGAAVEGHPGYLPGVIKEKLGRKFLSN